MKRRLNADESSHVAPTTIGSYEFIGQRQQRERDSTLLVNASSSYNAQAFLENPTSMQPRHQQVNQEQQQFQQLEQHPPPHHPPVRKAERRSARVGNMMFVEGVKSLMETMQDQVDPNAIISHSIRFPRYGTSCAL